MAKRECCMTTNLCCGCRRRILDHHLWHVTNDGRRWHKLCWQRELDIYAAAQTARDNWGTSTMDED